jgi:hypothetical protein
MYTLISSSEFWFGAFFLCSYQIGKFSELNTLDQRLTQVGTIPNLRTIDFVGPRAFVSGLIAFVLFTFFFYSLVCLYTPPLIAGWLKVTRGTATAEEIAQTIAALPYPLYIAGVLTGLSHQALPGVSRIGDIQRDVFHFLIGVPRVAIDMAASAVAQRLAEDSQGSPAETRANLLATFKRISSPSWIASLSEYGDLTFYTNEIKRLRLAIDEEEYETISERELRSAIESLIYAAAFAAARRSGSYGLLRLSNNLGTNHRAGPMPFHHFRIAFILFLLGAVFFLFMLPLLAQFSSSKFLPQDVDQAGVYIVAQMLPIFLAVICMIVFVRVKPGRQDGPGGPTGRATDLLSILSRYSLFFLFVLGLIVIYDFAQAFAEFGIYTKKYEATLSVFIASRLPYYILHAAISLTVCLMILRFHQMAVDGAELPSKFVQILQLSAATALVSGFFAACRMKFQFNEFDIDFVTLVVVLNVGAAIIAFRATNRAFEQYVRPAQLVPSA